VLAAALVVLAVGAVVYATRTDPSALGGGKSNGDGSRAPELQAKGWINTKPLTADDLKGKVVVYDFWTYSCVNCQRTLPHLRALYDRYKGDGLVVVGIHSPEFDFEKDHDNVGRATQSLGVTWPVALDDEMDIWNAFTNRAWPAEYLTDRDGRLRAVRFGEGDYDEKENDVRTLLGIPSGAPRAAPAGGDPVFTAAITPEIHFGLAFGGNQISSSPQPLVKGTQTYTVPDPLLQDTFALQGNWTVTEQGVESVDASATFVLRYRATEVNLVAGSATPAMLQVDLDGAPLAAMAVGPDDLYNIVTNGPDGYHTLTFRPGVDGFQAFAFTFGAGTK
jgi:thiol-disulfide isomerase/thioredoxin